MSALHVSFPLYSLQNHAKINYIQKYGQFEYKLKELNVSFCPEIYHIINSINAEITQTITL